MPPLCGIDQNLHCVMMQYSLHHASTMHLRMRSNGPHLKKDVVWVHIYKIISRCIGFIDGTLINIRKPWQNEAHGTLFNGWKKRYMQ
jgi:hypothetical protein